MNNADFLRYGHEMMAAEQRLRVSGQRQYQIGHARTIQVQGITLQEELRYEASVRVAWEGVRDGRHVVNVFPQLDRGWPSDKAIDEFRAICSAAKQWALDPFASELPPSGPWEKQ